MARPKPEPTLIRSPEDAEETACAWLRYYGFDNATTTGGGADGGVDVVGEGIVAQVKAQTKPTGSRVVREIQGVASLAGDRAAFFSLSRFTPSAVSFADEAGIALFRFDLSGEPRPVNPAGRRMAVPPRPVPEPAEARPPQTVTDLSPGQRWKAVAPDAALGIALNPDGYFPNYTAELRLRFDDCAFALFISQKSVRVREPSSDPLTGPLDVDRLMESMGTDVVVKGVTSDLRRHLVGEVSISNAKAAEILRSSSAMAARTFDHALASSFDSVGDADAIRLLWSRMLTQDFLSACHELDL